MGFDSGTKGAWTWVVISVRGLELLCLTGWFGWYFDLVFVCFFRVSRYEGNMLQTLFNPILLFSISIMFLSSLST